MFRPWVGVSAGNRKGKWIEWREIWNHRKTLCDILSLLGVFSNSAFVSLFKNYLWDETLWGNDAVRLLRQFPEDRPMSEEVKLTVNVFTWGSSGAPGRLNWELLLLESAHAWQNSHHQRKCKPKRGGGWQCLSSFQMLDERRMRMQDEIKWWKKTRSKVVEARKRQNVELLSYRFKFPVFCVIRGKVC